MTKSKLRFEEIDEASEYNVYSGQEYIGWIQQDLDDKSKRWIFCSKDNGCFTQNQLKNILDKIRRLNSVKKDGDEDE